MNVDYIRNMLLGDNDLMAKFEVAMDIADYDEIIQHILSSAKSYSTGDSQ